MKSYKSFSHINTDQIQAIKDCMVICKACSKMCIDEGHKQTASLCQDCSEFCSLTLNFLCDKSMFCNQALELCSEICHKCADACDKMNVQHCKECADACNSCSNVCKNVRVH